MVALCRALIAVFLCSAGCVAYANAQISDGGATASPVAQTCVHTGTTPTERPQMQAAIDQMHVPPRPYTSVMLSLEDGSRFGIRIDAPPGAAFTLDPERARLGLEDGAGRAVESSGRLEFDPCIPYPQGARSTEPPLPTYWIGFRLRWAGLPSGMYRITASFEPSFATDVAGKPIAIDQRYGPASTKIYVPPSPVSQPGFVVGQRFIVMADFYGFWSPPRFTDPEGSVPDDLGGRVLTLVGVSDTQLEFTSDGVDGRLAIARPSGNASIPDLYALVDDPTVLRLRSKYEGHQVWGFGGTEFREGASNRDSTRDPLTISGIYRIFGFSATMGIGSPEYWGLDLDSDFDALHPLVVIFRTPPSLTETPSWMARHLSPDTVIYSLVSDAWDFERSYSLISMTRQNPTWPAVTIDDIQKGHVRMGMSKAMIAWMFGYPNAYGTVAQVSKLETWSYDAPTPGQFAVYFKHGTVVRFDPPGQLP